MGRPSFAILIPARYASTRYPGKPLVALKGADGTSKTLIQRSYECAKAVEGCVGVWVATDDQRIADEVERFGGQVVMTGEERENGTARCAEAIATLGEVADIIVNLQGDAPLSPAAQVPALVEALAGDPEAAMATLAVRCSRSAYDHLAEDARNGRVGGTTVVFNKAGRALYFSKQIIPYLPARVAEGTGDVPVHMHLGIYAYRPSALSDYLAAPVSEYETLEGLEQLRFLDLGLPVQVVAIDNLGWDSIELNNPSDVPQIEAILSQRGIN